MTASLPTDPPPASELDDGPAEGIVEAVTPGPRRAKLRIALVVGLFVGLYAIGKFSGALDHIDIAAIRSAVENAGVWGFAMFVLLFTLGVLMQVPGMLFVGTGILVYGRLIGYFAGLSGAIVAVCASFLMVRLVGGKAFAEVKRPFLRKLLNKLDERPIFWMVLLRLVAFISPPLNYALALSNIRFRDYAIGSAVGLVLPMAVMAWMFNWLFNTPWVANWLFR